MIEVNWLLFVAASVMLCLGLQQGGAVYPAHLGLQLALQRPL
jgi:hypothetical protein